MEFLDSEIFQSHWFVYGLALMIIIPVLVILFNELSYSLKKNHDELVPPVNTIKSIIIPMVALAIVLSQVLDLSRSSNIIKILETVIWILIVNALLAIINILFLSGGKSSLLKTKIPQLFLDIFRVAMVLLGVAIILSTVWGMDLGNLVTALGLGSFVIGLALQDTLGNLFSGIALVYEKPFTEGDYINIDEHTGKVIEMNWRAVRMETREKELIVIPHLVIGQGTIKNFSRPTTYHIMKTEIGFSYDIPPNKVKKALLYTLGETTGVLLDPEPEVKTQSYGDSKIMYEIEFAIANFKEHEDVMDEFMSKVWYTARRYDLLMPLPQLAIHNTDKKPTPQEAGEQHLEESLRSLPKLLPIDNVRIEDLMGNSKIQYFGVGEKVIKQNDLTGSLYIILEGKALLQTRTKDGKELTINTLSHGDFFGEVALFTSKTSSFTVTAIDDLKLINIHSDEVLNMIDNNPEMAQQLDEIMDSRRVKIEQLKNQRN